MAQATRSASPPSTTGASATSPAFSGISIHSAQLLTPITLSPVSQLLPMCRPCESSHGMRWEGQSLSELTCLGAAREMKDPPWASEDDILWFDSCVLSRTFQRVKRRSQRRIMPDLDQRLLWRFLPNFIVARGVALRATGRAQKRVDCTGSCRANQRITSVRCTRLPFGSVVRSRLTPGISYSAPRRVRAAATVVTSITRNPSCTLVIGPFPAGKSWRTAPVLPIRPSTKCGRPGWSSLDSVIPIAR